MDINWAMQALEQYGMLGVFIVIMMEYSCLPMPSEVLLPFAGFLMAASGMPLAFSVACSVFAGIIGSTICYCLAKWGGSVFMDKVLRRFPKSSAALQKTMKWQNEMGGLSVMIARVIPLFRTWVSFAAGFAKQPFGTFILYSTIGIILWNTVLLSSGYYLFHTGIVYSAGRLWMIPLLVSLVFAIVILSRRVINKKRPKGLGPLSPLSAKRRPFKVPFFSSKHGKKEGNG